MLSSWVLIDSPTHLAAVQRGIAGIAAELRVIRETRGGSTGAHRRAFAQTASTLFETVLSADDRSLLATERLDSADRSKVVADTANRHAAAWLEQLRSIFAASSSDNDTARLFCEWAARFEESKYSKGVVGEMKSVAWQASHASESSGLTSRLLGEVAWSLFNSLHLSLRIALGRELVDDETRRVLDAVQPCSATLLELWLQTARIGKHGRAREGRLGAIWREADALQARVIAEQRKAGDLPRFDPSPVSVRENERSTMTASGRLRLQERLQFRIIENYQAPPQAAPSVR